MVPQEGGIAVNADSATLVDRLRENVEQRGDRAAYTFLPDGDNEGPTLTWAELDRDARAIAAAFEGRLARGDRALIIAIDPHDFIRGFAACLYSGVIAVPAYPPFPMNSEQRLATLCAIAADSGARAVLTSGPDQLVDAVRDAAPDLRDLDWLRIDHVQHDAGDGWRPPRIGRDDVAFLQYTSGSTSLPKGVVVTHGCLMHNEELIQRSFQTGPDMRVVGWLPLYHDMGLIGNVLHTLYVGGFAALMTPVAFVQRPARWLRAISAYRGDTCGGPNFAYELCARRIREEELEGVDLSSWRLAFNGAEPVRSTTIEAFTSRFAPHGFDERAWYPCYGLAEVTLLATGAVNGEPPRRLEVSRAALQEGGVVEAPEQTLVSSGICRLYRGVEIVDPETCRRAESGRVGEIWLAGPDLGRGYWRRPEESARTFEARIADTDEGPFLRTGDLGFVHEGELYVTGRLKDLIIVGGRNVYPQDVEDVVGGAHPAIRVGCVVAFAVDDGERAGVVVVAETKRVPGPGEDDPEGVRDEVAQAVRAAVGRAHGIELDEVVLVPAQTVPKTSSGKLQRRACRDLFLDGGLDAARTRDRATVEVS